MRSATASSRSLDPERVRAAVRDGREHGYSFLDSVVFPGTAAIGVAFPADDPIAAISVAAISARLDAARRASIAAQLQRQIGKLTPLLAGAG